MTTKRVSMQKIKDILRLKYDAKLPLRQIALSLSLSLGAVSKYLKRAKAKMNSRTAHRATVSTKSPPATSARPPLVKR